MQEKYIRVWLTRIAVGAVILLCALVLSLYVYNGFFRYRFERVFIGIIAFNVYEKDQKIAITLDPEQFIEEHQFELP